MCMDEDVSTSTMPPTIDELRWLYLSSALDSLAASPGRISPSSLRSERQRKLSQSLPTLPLGEDGKLSDLDTTFHFHSASASTTIHKSSSPMFATTSSKRPSCHRNSSSSRAKAPCPATSPCQEWIYRRPNKSAASCYRPSPSTFSRGIRHYKSQDQLLPLPESNARAAHHSDQDASSFWSTVLRQRPMLKERPSRAHLVISSPFTPPLPTISPNSSETTFRSENMDTSPLRTPSVTSIASTVSSISAPNTPTVASFTYARRQHPLRNPASNWHIKSSSDYSPSFSPSKSILTRSSSMSTSGSHTTSSAGVPSPTKSVKFVETPVVHYASRGHWDLESLREVEASQCLPDDQMGMDMEEMDLGSDNLDLSQMTEKNELELTREVMCVTPTLDTERGRGKGLQRIISLKRRASLPIKRNNSCPQPLSRRPTISGPYVLGPLQDSSVEDNWPLSSPPLSDHSPLQRPKSSQPMRSVLLNRFYLRSAPSLESVRSTRSAAAKSLRRVGSINGVNSTRGVRAWLEKIRLG